MPQSPPPLHAVDLAIVALYLAAVAALGFWIKRRATRGADAYFLAGRNVPWWILGLAGCSSYIDIGGTMGMVGLLYYTGLKGLWLTHLWWGWFIICFYMAFQAKYIRRSGVATFAEWNERRFGTGRGVEAARLSAALFLLLLMVFNLMFIAVGIGKFGEEVLEIPRWQASLAVFAVVGVYVTAGGFFGVIFTDVLQTILIAAGTVILTILVFQTPETASIASQQDPAWSTLAPTWTLWDGFLKETPANFAQYYFLGPCLTAGFIWCLFRVLAGPNVWDFQFFLTARSSRDAALAGGVWTLGYTLRWILGCAFLALGMVYFGDTAGLDAERLLPRVIGSLGVGLRGLFLAILLAALMSTLDAMINVTSSVVVNDFLKRYLARNLSQKGLVRSGQVASVAILVLAFGCSLGFENVVDIWETMIFGVVTMILVPATLRWHWWRFGPWGFVGGMAGSAAVIALQKIVLPDPEILTSPQALAVDTIGCLGVTLAAGFLTPPAKTSALLRFYAAVRPFGFWGPIRREAARRGLVPQGDTLPRTDAINGLLTVVLQFALAVAPFYAFLRNWPGALSWGAVALAVLGILYVTWYRNLPSRSDDTWG